jgi:hypothetical protein
MPRLRIKRIRPLVARVGDELRFVLGGADGSDDPTPRRESQGCHRQPTVSRLTLLRQRWKLVVSGIGFGGLQGIPERRSRRRR